MGLFKKKEYTKLSELIESKIENKDLLKKYCQKI